MKLTDWKLFRETLEGYENKKEDDRTKLEVPYQTPYTTIEYREDAIDFIENMTIQTEEDGFLLTESEVERILDSIPDFFVDRKYKIVSGSDFIEMPKRVTGYLMKAPIASYHKTYHSQEIH